MGRAELAFDPGREYSISCHRSPFFSEAGQVPENDANVFSRQITSSRRPILLTGSGGRQFLAPEGRASITGRRDIEMIRVAEFTAGIRLQKLVVPGSTYRDVRTERVKCESNIR